MKHIAVPILILTAVSLCMALAAPNAVADTPEVGDKAPLVEGKTQDGNTWKLAEALKEKAVLLYFYPKDDTPGCTKEACGFRDRMSELKQQGVEVVGVSFDSAESHQKFIEKYDLNFSLLADTEGKITEQYGAKMTGRDLARRVSFLINKDGRIAHVTDNPSAEVHLKEMEKAVAKLSK